jgi:hypothetical protein
MELLTSFRITFRMKAGRVILSVLALVGMIAPGSVSGEIRTPVVVELFTSEGCSSCPARLPAELRGVYRKIGADLEKYNGDASWELPIPGSYAISQDGLIKYASVDPDYTLRPEPDEIIDAIKKLAP